VSAEGIGGGVLSWVNVPGASYTDGVGVNDSGQLALDSSLGLARKSILEIS